MAKENGQGVSMDLNATGQPDTPVEYLVSVLGQALRAHDPQKMRALVQDAYDVVAGLDPYLDSISTPPSHVRDHSGRPAGRFGVLLVLWTRQEAVTHVGVHRMATAWQTAGAHVAHSCAKQVNAWNTRSARFA